MERSRPFSRLLAPTHTTKEVPTFAAYADEFKKTYVLANNKPPEQPAGSALSGPC